MDRICRIWDVFEIEGGMRDHTGQKWQINMTSARHLLIDDLCFS